MKPIHAHRIHEEIWPHQEIHLQTLGDAGHLDYDVSIEAGAIKLAQALAFRINREWLIYLERQARGLVLKDFAGLVQDSNRSHPLAFDLSRGPRRCRRLSQSARCAGQAYAGQTKKKNCPRTIRNHSPL